VQQYHTISLCFLSILATLPSKNLPVCDVLLQVDSPSDDEDKAAETSTTSSCNESQLVAGNDGYSAAYETLQTIGKGAFGYVRLARRRADRQLVSVAVFTCKRQQRCQFECSLQGWIQAWVDRAAPFLIDQKLELVLALRSSLPRTQE